MAEYEHDETVDVAALRSIVYERRRSRRFSFVEIRELARYLGVLQAGSVWKRPWAVVQLAIGLVRYAPELLYMARETLDKRWRCAGLALPPLGVVVLVHAVGRAFTSGSFHGGTNWVDYDGRPIRVVEWRKQEGSGAMPWHDDCGSRVYWPPELPGEPKEAS